MDEMQVLVNILNEMKTNLQVILRLARLPSSESIESRFYRWIQNPVPVETLGPPPVFGEVASTLYRFAHVVSGKIVGRCAVDSGQMRLAKLETETFKAETRLRQLEMNAKEVETARRIERQSRLDLIRDLQLRLKQTKERTAASLRLAKECGEVARAEWQEINRKPLEELELHYKMLNTRFAVLVKDHAVIEAQLIKCREERAAELERVKSEMEEDILIRKAELDQLRRDTLVETIQLKELEEELAVITSEYDEILATKKEEEREEIRRRLEERRRERAAIKIQQWFRFFLFRTMKSRRKKKKSKSRKISKEVVKKDSTVQSIDANALASARQESQHADDEKEDDDTVHVPPVATVLVTQRKVTTSKKPTMTVKEPVGEASTANAVDGGDTEVTPPPERPPSANNADSSSKKAENKKPGHAIRSITVKKSKAPNPGTESSEAGKPPASINVDRSSQTDNRVPKSKQVYR